MGLSTHVLDTMRGCPAAGMNVDLYTTGGEQATLVKRVTLNEGGRSPGGLLFDRSTLKEGTYRLVFDDKRYFDAKGVKSPELAFLHRVALDFVVADVGQHYHVPLLASLRSYPT